MPPGALDDMEPDEKRIHEATGNEGATVEHVYHCLPSSSGPRGRLAFPGRGVQRRLAWYVRSLPRTDAPTPTWKRRRSVW